MINRDSHEIIFSILHILIHEYGSVELGRGGSGATRLIFGVKKQRLVLSSMISTSQAIKYIPFLLDCGLITYKNKMYYATEKGWKFHQNYVALRAIFDTMSVKGNRYYKHKHPDRVTTWSQSYNTK